MSKKPIKPVKQVILQFVIEKGIKCAYCNRIYDGIKTKRTIDHVTPKSKNGQTTPDNVIVCCNACNFKKGNIDLEDFIKENKRVKGNLKKYFSKTEELLINRKYYNSWMKWVIDLIKKDI